MESQIHAAAILLDRGQVDNAEAIYRSITRIDSKSLDALLGLGQCERLRHDHASALRRFQEAVAAHPSNPWPHFEIATEHRNLGQFDLAEAAYHAAISASPGHSSALVGLGQCARLRGDRVAAMSRFQEATADPNNPWPHCEIATEYRDLGHFDRAEAAYNTALLANPRHSSALVGLGQCARLRGDRATAMMRFQEAAAIDNNSPWPQFEIAIEHRDVGQIADAEAAYFAVLEFHPGNSNAFLGLGHCARLRGDRIAALECFQKAAANDHSNPWPRLEIAAELRDLGEFDNAEAAYQAALLFSENRANALVGLGQCARLRGDRATAMIRFREAAAADPESPWPYFEIATEHRDGTQIVAAEEAYRAILKIHPRDSNALLGLGQCARLRGDRELATARFQEAALVDPNSPWPHLELAIEFRDQGRLSDAEIIYETARLIRPHDANAVLGLGQCARLRGDRSTAIERFQEAAGVDPNNPWPLLELATELRDAGEFGKAIDVVETLLTRSPTDPKGWMSIGATFRRAGRPEAALEAFRKALAINPQNPDNIHEAALEERALGRVSACRDLLLRGLKVGPHHANLLVSLADLARLEYLFDDSEALLRQAIRAHPADPTPRSFLAQLHSELGDLNGALEELHQFTQQFGLKVPIAAHYADILVSVGEYTTAFEHLNHAQVLAPWDFNIWMQRIRLEWIVHGRDLVLRRIEDAPARTTEEVARVHQLRGQIAEDAADFRVAIDYYKMALGLHRRDIGTHYDLARASLLVLDIDKTREHLRSIAELDSSSIRLQKRSSNISQTHLGQLSDDFELDAEALEKLKIIKDYPPLNRIPQLLKFINEAPDYTAGACLLIAALRQLGSLDLTFATKPFSGSLIPRSIVQYWNSADIPKDLLRISRSWPEKNPGYEHFIYDDVNARTFMSKHFAKNVLEAYERASEPAQKADIFRLAYLFCEGGYYVDMDDLCLQSLDQILPQHSHFACYQESFCTIGNNFLAAIPRSAIIGRALDLAVTAVNRGDSDILWLSTGPGVLTRAFGQVLAESLLGWDSWLCNITILDWHLYSRSVAAHCPVRYKKTKLHWTHTALGRRRTVSQVLEAQTL